MFYESFAAYEMPAISVMIHEIVWVANPVATRK
jgi:hypothetical protein